MVLVWLLTLSSDALGQFTHTQLRSFGQADKLGAEPFGRVTLSRDGVLYGTTLSSGGHYEGTIFRVNQDGSDYRLLHLFTGRNEDGATPYAELLEASDGAFYGTTRNGGVTNQGTIFRISKDGNSYTVLRRFSSAADGANPSAGLIEGTDGWLYGTAHFGGRTNLGTIFKLAKDGSGFAVIHHFTRAGSGGVQPVGGVIEGRDGLLYGTTYFGGASNEGTVFRIKKDGTEYRVLRSFSSAIGDGINPYAGVIEGTDQALYGTTYAGGSSRAGAVFRVNRDGTGFRVLRHFTATGDDGAQPYGGVIEGSDEALYGTTSAGGAAGQGTIFKLNKDGRGYAVVRSFPFRGDAAVPQGGLVEASDGTLFGASQYGGPRDQGTVFKLRKDGSNYAVVHTFLGGADAAHSFGGLIRARDASFIGSTWDGGSANGGTIFRIQNDGSGYDILHNFEGGLAEGLNPFAAVTQASDGAIYGTTIAGGSASRGIVFKLNQDGTQYRVLHHFTGTSTNGMQPYGGVIEGIDGVLYGTSAFGGSSNLGTIYKINRDGTGFGLLHQFTGGSADGQSPYSSLLRGSDGFFYGTTPYGGRTNFGVVFRLRAGGGGFQILHSFTGEPEGKYPFARLIEGSNGVLYGTTTFGGTSNLGTVFRINRDGTGYQNLRSFTGLRGDAAKPGSSAHLVEGPDGALYGTTYEGGSYGSGAIFKLSKDGTGYSVIHHFNPTINDGVNPFAGLVTGVDGALYAATINGGQVGAGAIFRIAPAATLSISVNGDLSVAGPAGYKFSIQFLDQLGLGDPWKEYGNVILPASPAKVVLPAFGPGPQRIYRALLETP